MRLPSGVVDRRLWVGASESGWVIQEAVAGGHTIGSWQYVSPDGQAFKKRSEVVQRHQPHDTLPRPSCASIPVPKAKAKPAQAPATLPAPPPPLPRTIVPCGSVSGAAPVASDRPVGTTKRNRPAEGLDSGKHDGGDESKAAAAGRKKAKKATGGSGSGSGGGGGAEVGGASGSRSGSSSTMSALVARPRRGMRIEIYWPGEREWFAADVLAYDTRRAKHFVRYVDDQYECEESLDPTGGSRWRPARSSNR
jgi:hypothetical protein